MKHILAIDQGTSSSRAIVFDLKGAEVCKFQKTLTQFYPKKGYVEHDPEEIFEHVLKLIKLAKTSNYAASIACLGITNQRETIVMWDKTTGKTLAPAIVWQDRRTHDFCLDRAADMAYLQSKTGLVLDAYFSASKINWLLNHVPDALRLLNRNQLLVGTIDSFLIWRLTKGRRHVTDMTNASRTMLFNIHEKKWDDDLLNYFSIPRHILPEVLPNDGHFGDVDDEYWSGGLPITGVMGDQQAALFGQACVHQGMIKATFGTGGFLMMNTGDRPITSHHKLLTTMAWTCQNKTSYALEGGFYHAGTTMRWLRDELKLIDDVADSALIATSIPNNGGVYLISSFTGLGAPHWLETSGAVIKGLSLSSGRAHIIRAALEGVVYQTRDLVDAMILDAHTTPQTMRVDGGMAKNSFMLQFLANQCNISVEHPAQTESTVSGVAKMAGIGFGLYRDISELTSLWLLKESYQPETVQKSQTEADYAGWKNALQGLIN